MQDIAEIRQLAKALFDHKQPTPDIFAQLLQAVFMATVFEQGQALVHGYNAPEATVGNRAGKVFRLNNGLFLKFRMDYKYSTNELIITESNFQYQWDEARMSDKYFFRYDFVREPGQPDHPTAHLQINGTLPDHGSLKRKLPDIRFPVNRPSVESMLRLLITDFELVPNTANWQEALIASEEAFLDYQAEKRLNK